MMLTHISLFTVVSFSQQRTRCPCWRLVVVVTNGAIEVEVKVDTLGACHTTILTMMLAMRRDAAAMAISAIPTHPQPPHHYSTTKITMLHLRCCLRRLGYNVSGLFPVLWEVFFVSKKRFL
jgi:hypothetical protein